MNRTHLLTERPTGDYITAMLSGVRALRDSMPYCRGQNRCVMALRGSEAQECQTVSLTASRLSALDRLGRILRSHSHECVPPFRHKALLTRGAAAGNAHQRPAEKLLCGMMWARDAVTQLSLMCLLYLPQERSLPRRLGAFVSEEGKE